MVVTIERCSSHFYWYAQIAKEKEKRKYEVKLDGDKWKTIDPIPEIGLMGWIEIQDTNQRPKIINKCKRQRALFKMRERRNK